MIYYISDTHFFHNNILKYCKRPFADVDEMNKVLIENWNSRVNKNDDIYHLGDFGFGSTEAMVKILSNLNGRKHFIRGNHDKMIRGEAESHFIWCKDYHKQRTDKEDIILFHYAQRVWDKRHYGALHFYGHSHSALEGTQWGRSMDVGVDNIVKLFGEYRPVSLDELRMILYERPLYPENEQKDHHTNMAEDL